MENDPIPHSTPAVKAMDFVECDQLLEIVRGGQGEFIQARAGRCLGSMRQINFDGLEMLSADVSNTNIVHAAAKPDIKVIHLPIHWEGDMRWNGRPVKSPTAIIWGDDPEWNRIASDSSVVTLGLNRDTLFAKLAAWSAREPEDLWRFDGEILDPTEEIQNLLATVSRVVQWSKESPEWFDQPKARINIQDSILTALFQAACTDERPEPVNVSLGKRLRVASEAYEYLRENDTEDVSLLDLCHVTGVSARTVAYAFEEHMGMSPFQYLKLRRLRRVRSLLRGASPGDSSVTACAREAGFSHMGRFSAAYRKFFGESPSATLGEPRV